MAVVNLSTFFGGKPWWQSWTARGLILWQGAGVVLEWACGPQVSLITAETCAMLTGGAETLGQILVVLGIRKGATAANEPPDGT